MSLSCKGCGAKLQTIDARIVGYIDGKHLERGLCQRCFKIKQYSDFHHIELDNSKLISMFDRYDKKSDLLTLVVDLSDLQKTCLLDLATQFVGKRLIVVVNKIDIILRDMRRYDLWEAQISALFSEHHIIVEQFFFVSAKEQLGMKRLIRYYEASPYEEIRVIGCANVGKSSLISALFHDSQQKTVIMPTIFLVPGTTLEELCVPWGDKNVYDTPGIMQRAQLPYYLTPKMIKAVALQKPIKPKIYHVYEPQTFFIGGYVQINVYPEYTNTISFFVSDTVPIHRKKLVSDNTFYEQHRGKLLSPPTSEELANHEKLLLRTSHSFAIAHEKQDIVIAGLGWIAIKEVKTKIEIIAPDGVAVYLQSSLV